MDRGELVGDDLIIGDRPDRLARPDAARGFVLDGFPRTVPQADALDEMLVDRGPADRRGDSGAGRGAGAAGACRGGSVRSAAARCRRLATVRRRRACAPIAAARWCRGRTIRETVVRDRLKVYWRETQPMIAFYHARPTYRAVDGAQPPERVRDALVAAVASALGKPAGDLKRASAAAAGVERVIVVPFGGGDRAPGAGQRAGGARARGAARRWCVPGVTTARARRARGAAAGGGGRGAGVQGVSRISGDDLRVGERAGRARDSVEAAAGRRRHRVDRHGREARWVLRRLRGDGARSGRSIDDAARLLKVTEASLYQAIEVGAAGRAGVGHRRGGAGPCRERTASRWCASSSATGSAPSCTRSRRFRTTALAGRGPRLAEGMVLAIEPMVNFGKPAVKVLGDGWTAVTQGRQPVGALRAHGGGDGGRVPDPDEVRARRSASRRTGAMRSCGPTLRSATP